MAGKSKAIIAVMLAFVFLCSFAAGEETDEDFRTLLHARDYTEGKWTDGYYLRTQDGGKRDNESFKAVLEYISTEGISTLVLYGGCYICFYDEKGEFLLSSGDMEHADQIIEIPVPDNAAYFRAAAETEANPIIEALDKSGRKQMVFDPQENIAFAEESIPENALSIQGIPVGFPSGVRTVGKETADYQSVQAAVNSCDGNWLMWIFPGIYEESVDCSTGIGQGKEILHFIGMSKYACKIVRHGIAYGDDAFLPGNQVVMENLSVFAYKAAGAESSGYALHLDDDLMTNGSQYYENCYFYSEGRAAAGIGTRSGCDIVFRNCVFETDSDEVGAVFIHNSTSDLYDKSGQNIVFDHCTIHASKGPALFLQYVGDDRNTVNLTMIDCTIFTDSETDEVVMIEDTTYYTGEQGFNFHVTDESHGNNIDLRELIEKKDNKTDKARD